MMNRSRNRVWANRGVRIAALVGVCAVSAAGLNACGKKKPPPPPPPPPRQVEPPPPPVVSFDSISQDMKADPRVQFAPDLKLSDEEVARAVISLADAFARGDSQAIAALVSKSARPTIETINDMGGFTSDVEAVRVVYVSKKDDAAGLKSPMDAMDQLLGGDAAAIEQANKNLSPGVAERVAGLVTLLAAGGDLDATLLAPPLDADKLGKLREQWDKLKTDPIKSVMLEQIAAAVTGSTTVPGLQSAEYLALLAVQTPNGVDLTGWGLEKAFGKWTFNNASTDGRIRQSAAEWDGVGLAGFSSNSTTGLAVAAPPADDADADAPSSDTNPETPKDESAPSDDGTKPPLEKRTPRGPIKIPGG